MWQWKWCKCCRTLFNFDSAHQVCTLYRFRYKIRERSPVKHTHTHMQEGGSQAFTASALTLFFYRLQHWWSNFTTFWHHFHSFNPVNDRKLTLLFPISSHAADMNYHFLKTYLALIVFTDWSDLHHNLTWSFASIYTVFFSSVQQRWRFFFFRVLTKICFHELTLVPWCKSYGNVSRLNFRLPCRLM